MWPHSSRNINGLIPPTPAEAAFDAHMDTLFDELADISYSIAYCHYDPGGEWIQGYCDTTLKLAGRVALKRRLPVLDEVERKGDGTKKAVGEVVLGVAKVEVTRWS